MQRLTLQKTSDYNHFINFLHLDNKFVTIIIPVYKDWDRLSLCLQSLAGQGYPYESFEIIVVNNDTPDNIPKNYFIPVNCSIITETKAGSYSARNAALKLAKGEIIGFTDSDCIPDKNWINNAVKYFESNETCNRIAGKVSIVFKALKPTKAELYDKVYAFNQKRNVAKLGASVTANLFTYKYLFDKVGLFNDNLMSGGDFMWGIAASKAGYTIDYVDNVIVKHPGRYSMIELINKEKRIGGGQAIYMQKSKNKLINFYRFIKEAFPRFKEVKFIYHNGKELSTTNKIVIYLIRQYLLSIRAYEKLKVQSGKKSERI